MNTSYVRSNFFIPQKAAIFLTQEAKRKKTTKGKIVTKALQLLKKEKLKIAMEKYYANPENCSYETKMANESFFISD